MEDKPIDEQTWRTFEWADVKRFAWDACREVALTEHYDESWVFQDFLVVSKRKAYKSDNRVIVDSFFNNNNLYIPFLEEVIKDLIFWRFFAKSNGAIEIEDAVFSPTDRIREYEGVFRNIQDGDIDKVETYHIP